MHMAITANWSYPTAIRFGAGRLSELGDACQNLGMRNPLFVTDAGLVNLPIVAKAQNILVSAGLGRAIFSEVYPNPDDNALAKGLEIYRAGGHDGVVAFGEDRH